MLSWRKTFRPYITTSVRETLPNVFGHFTPTLSSNSIEKQLHVLVPVPVDETQPAGTLLESCEKKAKNKKTLLRGGAHGEYFQHLEICQNTFAQGGERKDMTWTCV